MSEIIVYGYSSTYIELSQGLESIPPAYAWRICKNEGKWAISSAFWTINIGKNWNTSLLM